MQRGYSGGERDKYTRTHLSSTTLREQFSGGTPYMVAKCWKDTYIGALYRISMLGGHPYGSSMLVEYLPVYESSKFGGH